MPEQYLAVDDELAGLMFPDGVYSDGSFIFAPGFISDDAYIPFKDTIDWAIEAATKASSPKAKKVIHSDTVWKVVKFHITFDEIGRLTHASFMKRVPRGYRAFTTLEKYPHLLSVRWPRRSPHKWLVTRGFKTHEKSAKEEACNCQNPHLTLYKLATDNFLCETCLIAQEQAKQPAIWPPASSCSEPPAVVMSSCELAG